MAAAEISQRPFLPLSEADLFALADPKKKSSGSTPAFHLLSTPSMQEFYESQRLFPEAHTQIRRDTVPLLPILDSANIPYQRHTSILTRLIEYQCAVLSNTEYLLQGAKSAESLLDVKIIRVEYPETGLPRSIVETDLDIVTKVIQEDGTKEVHSKECASSGKGTFTRRQHNVGRGEPKPAVVKKAYDGATLNAVLYRIPQDVMTVDSYTVIIPPHKRIADEVFRYVHSTAQPLVEAYGIIRKNAEQHPAVSVVTGPIDWTTKAKRWHKGMPQQTPDELADLIDKLHKIPRGGYKVKEVLTNAASYRDSSSPLFRPACSSQ